MQGLREQLGHGFAQHSGVTALGAEFATVSSVKITGRRCHHDWLTVCRGRGLTEVFLIKPQFKLSLNSVVQHYCDLCVSAATGDGVCFS